MTIKMQRASVEMELLKASFPVEIQQRSPIKVSFKFVLVKDMRLGFFTSELS